MKKWSFLVATLLLMGATATTFTSCVDTDEPEGILNMRNAKAEYIRALAAVENAKIAYQQAAAQNEQANAELLKAQAQAEILKAQIAADQAKIANECAVKIAEAQAQAELLRAEGEKNLNDAKAQIALAEAEKILAEAMDEKARTEQLIAENEIKLQEMKAKLEVVLQNAQTELLKSQAAYQLALKDIAALDLVLSPLESTILTTAKIAYTTAYTNLNGKANALAQAQEKLLDKMYTNEDATAQLEHKLADDKSKLAAMKATLAELEKLAADVTPTAWETRRDSLAKIIASEQLMKDELSLKIEEVKQSAEYKAAAKKDADARKAYVAAQQEYNYLYGAAAKTDCFGDVAADGQHPGQEDFSSKPYGTEDKGTHPKAQDRSAKTYEFPGIEIKVENATLQKKISSILTTKDDGSKVLQVAEFNADGTAKQYTYKEAEKAFKEGDNFIQSTKIDKWINTLKGTKITDEEIEMKECRQQYEKELEAVKAKHEEKVALWKDMHKQYAEKKAIREVPVTDFENAVKAYNDNFKKLDDAVKAYNAAYDQAVKDNKDAIMKQIKEYYGLDAYKDLLSTAPLDGIFGAKSGLTQVNKAQLDNLVKGKEVEIKALTDDAFKTVAKVLAKGQTAFDNAYGNKFNINEGPKVEAWAASKARDGVDAGSYTITGVDNKAVIAEKVKAVTEIEAVSNANKALNSTETGKEGIAVIISNTTKDNGKYKAGTQKSVEDALKAYEGKANELAQTQTDAAKKLTMEVLTGEKKYNDAGNLVDVTYLNGGSKDHPTYVPVGANWVVIEWKLDSDNNYVPSGHYTIAHTAATDYAKAEAVQYSDGLATTAWQKASKEAFGVVRHTELTAAMVKDQNISLDGIAYNDKLEVTTPAAVTGTDEKGLSVTLTGSTLGNLIAAQKRVDNFADLTAAAEALEALKTAVAEKKTSLQTLINGIKAEIDKAENAIAPAKEAHLAAHKAAQKLVEACGKESDITNTIKDLKTLKEKLNNILTAYYSDQLFELKYTDEDGNEQSIDWTGATQRDFSVIKKWVESAIKTYTKKDPKAATGVDTHGLIADQEAKIANLEKLVSRLEENGYTGKDAELTAAINNFVIVPLQEAVEKAQFEYDYYLNELAIAEANLNKVIEALGNGVALKPGEYPSSTTNTVGATIGGSSSYTGATSSGTTTTIKL